MLTLKLEHYDKAGQSGSNKELLSKDRILLEACQRGEQSAYKQLYESLAPVMMAVCSRYLRNDEDAKDALQECFIKGISSIRQFNGNSTLKTWLTRIAINHCINVLKKKKLEFAQNDGKEPVADENYYSEEMLWEKLRQEKMHFKTVLGLMDQLPDGYRTILNLYAIEGYGHREIAKLLNISQGTSKSQLARARAKLCKLLSAQIINPNG